jgi:hypothetical protein
MTVAAERQRGKAAAALTTRVACVVLIVVAAGVRLWRLDLVEFKADEAGWLGLAEDAVRLGHVPLAGMRSSQGISAPPHFAYVLAPLVMISRQPEFATAAIALANVAAVGGVFWLALRGFGRLAAIVATALYALNPWSVFWARKIWQPDLMAPLAVLLFFALDQGIVQRRLRWAAAAVPIGVFATMVHLSFAVLLPVLLAPVVVLARARRWWLLALAVALAGLVVAPTLIYEQQVVGWQDYRDFRYFQSQRSATNLVGLGYAVELFSGWGARTLVNVPLQSFAWPALVNAAGGLEIALLVLAIVVACVQLLTGSKGAERIRLLGLLLWMGLPIVLTLRHNMLLYPHYYLLLLPAPCILIGSGVQHIARSPRWSTQRVALPGLLVGVTAIVAVQGLTTAQFFGYLATTNPNCVYGVPLGRTREIADGVTLLGRRKGSSQVSLETGADGLGYLLRDDFTRIDAPDVTVAALGARRQPGPADSSGVQVLGDWIGNLSVSDGQPRLAIAWQVGGDVDPETPLHWQVSLGETPVRRGVARQAGDLQGRSLVSYLAVDVPRGEAAGSYPLQVALIDETSGQTLPLTLPGGAQSTRWTLANVQVEPDPGCSGEESAL